MTDEEYNEFFKSISKESDEPLAKTHFTAEGEVTFKSILYVPKSSPHDMFSSYGKKMDSIKVSLRTESIIHTSNLDAILHFLKENYALHLIGAQILLV